MGRPGTPNGAPAGKRCDASVPTLQRVSAALGCGATHRRVSTIITPDCWAASMRRRVALRSRAFGAPQISLTTAATAGHFAASMAARRPARASRVRTMRTRLGSRPRALSPSAKRWPISRWVSSCSIQTIVRVRDCACVAVCNASAAAKPRAAAASACRSATISCRAARCSPPPTAASIAPASRETRRVR